MAAPEPWTPERLTAMFRRSAVLDRGTVQGAAVLSINTTILSQIVRLKLSYAQADLGAPDTIILKRENPDRAGQGWDAGRTETAFYDTVAPALPPRLVPRCFGSHVDEADKTWHLCLEDLTETHHLPTRWPLPPPLDVCARIVQARAHFHATWWDDPRLGQTIGTRLDVPAIAHRTTRLAALLQAFFDRMGDDLSRPRRAQLERLLAAAPDLLEADAARPGLTIAHGDAHVWNTLAANDGTDVRLFDWDCWHLAHGADDLAYMMAMHWYPDRRARLEPPLLDIYHAALLTAGITGYDRAALDHDYRRAVLWLLTFPARQLAYGIPPVIWWNNFERIALAADDLGCEDLIA